MSVILDKDGKPTTVLCITPAGREILCETTEQLESVFRETPSCQLWFGGLNEDTEKLQKNLQGMQTF